MRIVVSVVFQKPQSDCCAHAAACKVVPRHHISYNKVLSYRQLSCQLKPGTVSRATTAALSIALQAIPPHTNLQHTSTRTDQPVRQYLVSTSLSDLSIIFCALVFTTTETAGYLTLLRFQRVLEMPTYTQGAAALYPGLCSSALTARAGQCIFCEQVVRVNQEQLHFGYIKLYTILVYIIYTHG